MPLTSRAWGKAAEILKINPFECKFFYYSVNCLTVDDSRHILIGGLNDGSVRMWKPDDENKASGGEQLKEHQMCVWAVLVVGQSPGSLPFILSASADKTIILWTEGKVTRKFQG